MDSEPAEVEGEAAENGDAGDTGAELDDGTGPESSELGEGVTAHVKVKAKRSEKWLLGLVVPSLSCTDLNTWTETSEEAKKPFLAITHTFFR